MKEEDGLKFLVFNKSEWQGMRQAGGFYSWTDAEIANADKDGLIGIKGGVKCYVSRPANWSSNTEHKVYN